MERDFPTTCRRLDAQRDMLTWGCVKGRTHLLLAFRLATSDEGLCSAVNQHTMTNGWDTILIGSLFVTNQKERGYGQKN